MRFWSDPFPLLSFLFWVRLTWPKICPADSWVLFLYCIPPEPKTDFTHTPDTHAYYDTHATLSELSLDALCFLVPLKAVMGATVTGAMGKRREGQRHSAVHPWLQGFLNDFSVCGADPPSPHISFPLFSKMHSEQVLTGHFKNVIGMFSIAQMGSLPCPPFNCHSVLWVIWGGKKLTS